MWKKVEPALGGRGPEPATQITVARYGKENAFLRIPASLVTHSRADVFVDGTRVGILQHDKGTYKLTSNSGAAKQITAPAGIRHLIPLTKAVPVNHVMEGPMIVIDMADVTKAQITDRISRAIAAE
jgi:hypothetical protein